MPSQQVTETLQAIQDELIQIAPAVMHIHAAGEVAQRAANVVIELQNLIKDLDSIEKQHRLKIENLLKEVIADIKMRIENAVVELEESTKQLGQLLIDISRLEKSVSKYFEKINEINFPERLDKIDNQISSINIGIQNLQGDVKRVLDKLEIGFKETSDLMSAGKTAIIEEIQKAKYDILGNVAKKIDEKNEALITFLSEENSMLKKEIKLNRIIYLVASAVILMILTYLIFEFQAIPQK